MTAPTAEHLFEVLDATWPAARVVKQGPWCVRDGQGGGKRVSAATASTTLPPIAEIEMAEEAMRALDQTPLFMLRPGEAALDSALQDRRYAVVDPVHLYIAEVNALTAKLKTTDAVPAWPPLAIQRELWADGGIGPARIEVMQRAKGVKTSLLGRSGDVPAGTVFVALHDDIAMVHGLEVDPSSRKQGVGKRLMQGAANWALTQGAAWMTLAVTKANVPANALYRSLGMATAAEYHYRHASDKPL